MAVYKFAGFWRRLVAYSIDNIIINIIFAILFLISSIALFAGAMSGDSAKWLSDLMNPTRISAAVLAVGALYLFLTIAYFTYFHGMNGRTPGKMLLSLQVLSTAGTPITCGIAFLRSVGYIVSGIFLNIGFIWAAFDRRKQGWHDKIAGTIVIIRSSEKEAAGIVIAESLPLSSLAPPVAKQNQTTPPPLVQTAATAENENNEAIIPRGANNQNIP